MKYPLFSYLRVKWQTGRQSIRPLLLIFHEKRVFSTLRSRYKWIALILAFSSGICFGLLPYFNAHPPRSKIVTKRVPIRGLRSIDKSFLLSAREAQVLAACHEAGDQWILDPFDSNEQPDASGHTIAIGGILLSHPHSIHADINGQGRGRYSFWNAPQLENGWIYLSFPEDFRGDRDTATVEINWRFTERADLFTWSGRAAILGLVLLSSGLTFWLRGLPPDQTIACLFSGWLLGALLGVLAPGIHALSGPATHAVGELLLTRSLQLLVLSSVLLFLWQTGYSRLSAKNSRLRSLKNGSPSHSSWIWPVVVMELILLGLFSSWVAVEPVWRWTGDSGTAVLIGGRLPFSDACGWYVGSQSVKQGCDMSWVARRPVHALFRAGELVIVSDDYQLSLIVQAFLLSVAIAGLVMVVRQVISSAAALLTMVPLVMYGGTFVGLYLSEASGFTAACIGVAFQLWGWAIDSPKHRWIGVGFLSLAAAIRPGPMLILPALPLCEFILSKGKRRWTVFVTVAIIAAGICLSSLAFQLIALPGAKENFNAADTILGLAYGSRWDLAKIQFIQENPARRNMSLEETSREMYKAAWRYFRTNPKPAFRLAWSNFLEGLHAVLLETSRKILRFDLLAQLGWCLSLGMLLWLILNKVPWALFLFLGLLATLFSLPVIWGDGSWRGVTIGLPLVFCALATCLSKWPCSDWARTEVGASKRTPFVLTIASFSFLVLIVLGTLFHVGNTTIPVSAEQRMGTIRPHRSPMVVVLPDESIPRVVSYGLKEAGFSEVVNAVRKAGLYIYEMDQELMQYKPPFGIAVFVPDNIRSEKCRWVILPGFSGRETGAIRIENLHSTKNPYISVADQWKRIDE